jgi:hypothetical protein
MSPLRIFGFGIALAALAATPAFALANDYPTKDRVEYVHICQRDYADKPAQEMLYKCSCVIDQIAEALSYDDYVEASTAFYAQTIAGERGQIMRNEATAHALSDQFKSVQAKAKKACFIN